MLRYVPLMLKNTLRNRRRSVLTILSIGASLCLLGLMFALYRGLFLAPARPGQELRLVTHHKVSMTQPLPYSYGAKIRQMPGVTGVMAWQWFGGTYKDARDRSNFFARFCAEPSEFFKVRPEVEMPEEQRRAFLQLRTGAIASEDLVERMHWKLGERIFIVGDIYPVKLELTLVGIMHDANTTETLYFNREYLRELLGANNARADMVGTFQVQVANADSVARVGKEIDAMFENSTAPTKSESEQAFTLQFISFLGNVKMYLMVICGAVTFTILLVSANTMAMSVRERTREVGILKTLGYSPGSILFMVLGEAGMISMIGGAIGVGMAAGLTGLLRSAPSFIQQMKTLTITPDVALLCVGLAIAIGVLSSLIPAWNAARMPILESLRSSG
jgi:putative ABC transport system permease protein